MSLNLISAQYVSAHYTPDYHRLRMAIFHRDRWQCQRCGRKQRLRLHHIIPRCWGGSNEERNLVTLCRGCHGEVDRVLGL